MNKFRIHDSVFDSLQEDFEASSRRTRFFNDPEGWVKYMLDEELWSLQREVAESLLTNKNTAVKAGHGVGKSHLASRLICWWVDTRAPDVFVASTAPSKAQVSQIIWDSIRSCYNKIESRYNTGKIDHKLPGVVLGDDTWKINGEIVGSGRKPPDGKVSDSFQGIHRRYVLAIGDEACGLPVDLIDSLGNITTNEGSRRFLIGNPTNPASHFAKIFKDMSHTWSLHTISVLDSPNFTGEPMSVAALESLTGPQFVEDKKLEYGEDSARYKARILGEFAYDIEDSLITPADIEIATANDLEPAASDKKILGVDVGGHGIDRTVLYLNHGGKIEFLDSWAGEDVLVSAEKVHKIAKELRADVVNIDAQGLGIGAYEMLVRLVSDDTPSEHAYQVGKIISSGASPDRNRWHNLRSVMWDNLRMRIREGRIALDPLDQDLHDELVSVQAGESESSGGLLIQSKKDFRKKNAKSPDLGDACVFAAFDVEEYQALYTDNNNKTLRTTIDDWDESVPVYDLIGSDYGTGYQYIY